MATTKSNHQSKQYKINKTPKDDTSDNESTATSTQQPSISPSTKSSQEILTLCIGQCGIFTASQFLSTIMNEHKLNLNGKFTGDDNSNTDIVLLSKLDTHFQLRSNTNTYTPNSMFIDNDISTINKIKSSPFQCMLNSDHFISGNYANPSVTHPKGYKDGLDIIDEVMDKIRKRVESYDYYQGSNIIHSPCGGFGSGFTSLLLAKLYNEYPKKVNLTSTQWPDLSESGCNPHNYAVYNTVL